MKPGTLLALGPKWLILPLGIHLIRPFLVFFLNMGLNPIPALSNTQFWEPKTAFKFDVPLASLEGFLQNILP